MFLSLAIDVTSAPTIPPFKQTAPGLIGAVTINHFDPGKDFITLSKQLTTTVMRRDSIRCRAA